MIKINDSKFEDTLNLTKLNKIKLDFFKKFNKPADTKKPEWWYKKTDFGVFFLNEMLVKSRIDEKVEPKDEDEWREYYPLFKHFFPTKGEYSRLKNNVLSWYGIIDSITEDTYFIRWVNLKNYCLSSLNEIESLPFKEQMMLYYYAMLNRVYGRPDLFSKFFKDNSKTAMHG